MRLTKTLAALILAALTLTPAADAGLFRHCHRHRQWRRAAACRPAAVYSRPAYYRVAPIPAPVLVVPVPSPQVQAPPPVQVQVQAGGDRFGAALAVINAARARHGKGPLGWSPDLAGWAARNFGRHGLMAPGAGQCQAWTASATEAAHQWLASPPHLAILMAATTEVGIGASEGGFTANVR